MSSGDDPAVSAGSYVLLGLGSAAYYLFLFAWFSLPAFLRPIIVDLGLSSTEAGFVAGAIQLVYIPVSLVSGLFIDRIGSRNAIAIGMVVIGVSHAIRAGADGFATVLLPTLLLGVGGTAITFGLPKLVSELFPPERTGSMSSVYIVAASLGTATAFGVGRPVLGPLLGGWRPLFLWSGALLVAFAAGWYLLATALWGRVPQFSAGDEDRGFTLGSIREDVTVVVSHRGLRLLVLVGTMSLFVNHGLQAWLATVLEVRGLGAAMAATVTSLFILVRIAGVISIPVLSDRLGARRGAVIVTGVGTTIGTVGVLLTGSSAWATVVAVSLIGLSLGGLAPLLRAIPIELEGIGPRLTATANGLIFTVGEVGGFLGPFLIGGLRDASGSFLPGFGALAVASAVIVVAGYVMEEPRGSPSGS